MIAIVRKHKTGIILLTILATLGFMIASCGEGSGSHPFTPVDYTAADPQAAILTSDVVPLITCESGYHVWQDGVDAGSYGITGEGIGNELEMEKPSGSCFKFTGSNTSYGELINEAGSCMSWNRNNAYVELEACGAGTYEDWESFSWDAGGNGYQNERALQVGNDGAVDLAAGEGGIANIGVILYAGGSRTPEDAWYLKTSG